MELNWSRLELVWISGKLNACLILFEINAEIRIKIKVRSSHSDLILYCSYLVEKIFGQDQGLDPVTADYLIYEEAGRFSLLLLRWVERGMKESPEKMAKMMEQIEVNLTK